MQGGLFSRESGDFIPGWKATDCDKIQTKEEVYQKIPLEKVLPWMHKTLIRESWENLEKLPQIQQAKIDHDYLINESARIDGFITIDILPEIGKIPV